jgi:chorismate dehydratase
MVDAAAFIYNRPARLRGRASMHWMSSFEMHITRNGKIRIGAVSYLNTKPLVYGLQQLAPWAGVVYDLPSRLADGLAAGRLDVALIPSIEFFQDPSYTIVSDACIGCRGAVMSVKLLSRKPLDRIRTLALDEGSRTSAVLVRVLLEQRFGVRPQLQPLPIGVPVSECDADAILMIGDRAIHPPADSFVEVWDLGDQWCRWSKLPFVFAMWVARAGTDLDGVEQVLGAARDAGVANLDEIAREHAASVGLTIPQCHAYLRDNLYFYLGPREQQGLELFYRHAAALGFAPRGLSFRKMGLAVS